MDLVPRKWWRLRLAYTYLNMSLHADSDSLDTESEKADGESPIHQISALSMVDLPCDLQPDTGLRYADNLKAQTVPGYLTLDLRLGWRPVKGVDLSLVGQNLLEKKHKGIRT